MDRKTAFFLVITPLFMSSLSVLLVCVDIGWKGALVFVIVCCPAVTLLLSNVLFSVGFKYQIKLALIFALGVTFAFALSRRYETALGLPAERVTAIEGRMLYDSSFSGSGRALVRISVQNCRDGCGNWTSAKGIVTAVGNKKAVVTCGLKVRLEGDFNEELFIYDTLQVTERSKVNDFREFLIERIEKRLFGISNGVSESPDEPALLSSLLLLGRSEDYNFPLKQAALNCGCAHVLALSGMHLSVLASLCAALFGKRKGAKVLSGIVIAAFVFIAGPRPSLIRSAIMFFLGKRFTAKQKVVMAFFIQSLLLPFSMLDIGCCYGYVSVFAIIYLWSVVKAPLEMVVGKKLVNSILLSVSVLLLCAPVQLIKEGQWCPVAILVSPLAGLLITISMIIGLFMLSFGRLDFLLWLNRLVYEALAKVFEVFGAFPKAGWLGYVIMVAIVLALEIGCLVYRTKGNAKVKRYRFNGRFDLYWDLG